mgnify:CR=1 FL=1
MEIFFGTNNPNKLKEIREMLGDRFSVKSFKDLDAPFDVEETEDSLEGNAALKARAFHKHTGMPCFSDDSGLEVDALNGAPGVYSARYSGPNATAADNNKKLLQELDGVVERSARFRAVIAYYDGNDIQLFEGKVEGNIQESASGKDGFGYDPLFQPVGYDTTFAEMGAKAKHAISHRGHAVAAFTKWLKSQ